METKKKTPRDRHITVVFTASDGKRVRTAANLHKESMSKFCRTIVRGRLQSLGYHTEDE